MKCQGISFQTKSGHPVLHSYIVFLKECFEKLKLILKKKSTDMKNYAACRVNERMCFARIFNRFHWDKIPE